MNEIPTFKFAIAEGFSESFLPQRGTDKASGWDVKAAITKPLCLKPGEYARIPLGFRVFAPDGWWLELRPRSSTFTKKHLHCLYGVIDEDYEGDCLFACQYITDNLYKYGDLIISPGDAIGQLIPVKRQEMNVEIVSDEEYKKLCEKRGASRGTGGFGSTGR